MPEASGRRRASVTRTPRVRGSPGPGRNVSESIETTRSDRQAPEVTVSRTTVSLPDDGRTSTLFPPAATVTSGAGWPRGRQPESRTSTRTGQPGPGSGKTISPCAPLQRNPDSGPPKPR